MYKPKTYKKDYLATGNKHELYYELSGNPNGKPVIYLHGGPGGGFSEKSKRFFNPKFKIIHFDQRGSGKSTPFASLKDNTTFHLVEDIKKLMDYLSIKKAFLFGGSWGSTLALVFAIKYPEKVAGMVLRGIYLPSKEDNFYFTYEARDHFPEQWKDLASLVPQEIIKRKKIEDYYYKKILSPDKNIREKYIKAWAKYELSISGLDYSEKKVLEIMKEIKIDAFSTIELHYLTHNCFLPKDYIMKNTHKISHIPASIIHGRYDCVCRPLSAYRLHKKLHNSKLFLTIAGHSASDKENENLLIKEMNRIGKLKLHRART